MNQFFLVGPFNKSPFKICRPCAPIGVVFDKYSSKPRLILDLSWPHDDAEVSPMNELIDRDECSPRIFDCFSHALEWILRNNYSIHECQHLLDEFLIIDSTEETGFRTMAILTTIFKRFHVLLSDSKTQGPCYLCCVSWYSTGYFCNQISNSCWENWSYAWTHAIHWTLQFCQSLYCSSFS